MKCLRYSRSLFKTHKIPDHIPVPYLHFSTSRVVTTSWKIWDRVCLSVDKVQGLMRQHIISNGSRPFCSASASAKKKPKKEEKPPEIENFNREVERLKSESMTSPLSPSGPSEYTFRSHTCGQLTAADVGTSVTLCGWLTFKRLNGTFLVLRDLYGVTQIYVPKELQAEVKKADEAPLESVLQINGKVALRPERQRRNDQVSGDIEVVAESVSVLNKPTEIRFNYNDYDRAEEELRIRHRHLHLRNAKVQSVLRTRSVFLSNVRRFMDANHFIDVETPTLLRRTPGGAREFPVVTKFKSCYYALAQSPQLLKQLLMAGGMDKYYQIARCYRDETGRPDRQPEFTQLDIEMSFTTREGVMKLVEDVLKYSCPNNILSSDNTGRFPVMTYKQCMAEYGSDKPDTGGFLWVVDFPLFLRNEQTGKLESAHHPFTMPQNLEEMHKNPEDATGLSYDLVYQGAEVGGGSIRIHDANLQRHVYKILSLPLEDIDYLLEALESGCPPHGGFALGIDRFLAKILKVNSIRDVIAFPKSGDGKDLLSGAPTPLDPDSKKFYGII